MNTPITIRMTSPIALGGWVLALAFGLGTSAASEAHQSFATAEDAEQGLVQALQKGDAATLGELFGPGSEALSARVIPSPTNRIARDSWVGMPRNTC